MNDRYFTLEQAQATVPWVQSSFDSIREARAIIVDGQSKLQALAEKIQSNGGSQREDEVAAIQTSIQESTAAIQGTLDEFTQRGIIVRDIQRGLIDFLSLRDDREVHLCWVYGEPSIEFWHEVDTGFAGRQPL